MSESIPLRATLSVESVCVVIDDVFDNCLDIMVERLTIKCRFLWDIKRKTVNDLANILNIFGYI